MKQSTDTYVTFHHVDFKGIARPSSILTFMQDAANMQMHVFGPSNEELWKKNQAFILSKISINFNKPLFAYDKITAESWAMPSRGYIFNRAHAIYRNGECVADSYSEWALIDTEKGGFIKVEDFENNYSVDEALNPTDYSLRFKLPAEEMRYVGDYRVSYADTDRNRHMNNTKYPDVLCGFVDMSNKIIKKMSISFQNEAPFNTKINVYYIEKDGRFYFKTIREDGKINIEAVAEFENFQ